ncbi:hypothetical protein FM106_08400 [Brachybacterium faecium]|nr:hypothetical protein FM106_08400 [Brachybacterium faecium]
MSGPATGSRRTPATGRAARRAAGLAAPSARPGPGRRAHGPRRHRFVTSEG